jgi:hypothetical protein
MIRRLALTLTLAALAPLAAVAQTPAPAPAAEPAPAAAPAAVPAPAPPAAPAPAADKVTVDIGGWLIFNSHLNWGGSNSTDLPQRASFNRDEIAAGMQVRQSRVRMVLGLPSDGLLGGAKLKGLVEADFMGGSVGGDASLPLVRFRHGFVSATWKDLGNLELLVGQFWGIYTGPYFAQSLAHIAVPRFGGAGFLFLRAPQVRLSGDLGGDLAVKYQLGAFAPMDRAAASTTAVASGAGVGERSGLPDAEGRVALVYREGKKQMVEVAVSGHYGQDRYALTSTAGTSTAFKASKTVESSGFAVDAKIDLPMVTLLGCAFQGKNLDVLNSSPGVRSFTTGTGATQSLDDVAAIRTQGYWAQLQVTPVAGLQLLAGGGMETPKSADLAAGAGVMRKNGQWSAGAVVNLTSKWKASLEFTHYVTNYNAAGARFMLDQAELSTLYAF